MRDFINKPLIKSAQLFLEAVIPHTLRENTRDVMSSHLISRVGQTLPFPMTLSFPSILLFAQPKTNNALIKLDIRFRDATGNDEEGEKAQ